MARLVAQMRSDDRNRVLKVAAMTAVVEVGLRTLGVATLARALGVTVVPSERGLRAQPVLDLEEVGQTVRAVDFVFRRMPTRGLCLRRSLVLGALLRAHGPELKIGVAPGPHTIRAHAWVQLGGSPLPELEGSSVDGFSVLR